MIKKKQLSGHILFDDSVKSPQAISVHAKTDGETIKVQKMGVRKNSYGPLLVFSSFSLFLLSRPLRIFHFHLKGWLGYYYFCSRHEIGSSTK
jgi:hypothetical protein